jgi:hypothetical protein
MGVEAVQQLMLVVMFAMQIMQDIADDFIENVTRFVL